MKILWRKRGFTTNSSGSYEWLSTSTLSGLSSSSSLLSSSSIVSLPTTTQANSIKLAGRFDWLILLLAIATGLVSIGLIIKETLKNKKHAHSKKRK
jgi:hypothetical protein